METGTIVDAGIWLNVECSLGIVCACLPIMRPFFRLAGSSFSSIRSRLLKYGGGTSLSSHEIDHRATSLEEIIPPEHKGFHKNQTSASV